MIQDPLSTLFDAGVTGARAYEGAATAVGGLDVASTLAPAGLRQLLLLRCMVTPFAAGRDGMIAVLRADGEGDRRVLAYGDALRVGSTRARGGFVPSVDVLDALLAAPGPATANAVQQIIAPGEPHSVASTADIDLFMRDGAVRTPPVLKAVIAVGALLALRGRQAVPFASLAASLLLCVGGATADALLTLPLLTDDILANGPLGREGWGVWLSMAFASLAREARAETRGLEAARERVAIDQARVREAFGRASYSAIDLLELLANDLIITVPDAARALDQTPPTAGAAAARLVSLGIAREITGRARSRAFVYEALIGALAPEPMSHQVDPGVTD